MNLFAETSEKKMNLFTENSEKKVTVYFLNDLLLVTSRVESAGEKGN